MLPADLTAQLLMAEMDDLDEAIAKHLCRLFGNSHVLTVSDCRRAIVAWCFSLEARALFDAESLDATAYAIKTMDDALLAPLIRDLLRGSARNRSSAA